MTKQVKINGADYPCRVTIGTLKRLKDETGKEFADLGDIFTLMHLLFIAIRESCKKEEIGFPYANAEEMMDDIEYTDVLAISEGLFDAPSPNPEGDGKKKRG